MEKKKKKKKKSFFYFLFPFFFLFLFFPFPFLVLLADQQGGHGPLVPPPPLATPVIVRHSWYIAYIVHAWIRRIIRHFKSCCMHKGWSTPSTSPVRPAQLHW